MSDSRQDGKTDRRSFLRLAGVGTLTGGAAIALSKSPVKASEAPVKKTGLYRETDHVKTYYESAKF